MPGRILGWRAPEDSDEEILADDILLEAEEEEIDDEPVEMPQEAPAEEADTDTEPLDLPEEAPAEEADADTDPEELLEDAPAEEADAETEPTSDSEPDELEGMLEEDLSPMGEAPTDIPAPVPEATPPPVQSEAGPSRPIWRRTARKSIRHPEMRIAELIAENQTRQQEFLVQRDQMEYELWDRERSAFHQSRLANRANRRAEHWEYAARRIAGNYRRAFLRIRREMLNLRSEQNPTATQIETLETEVGHHMDEARNLETYAMDWVQDSLDHPSI